MNTFLWYATGDPRLSFKARELIERSSSQNLLSIASVWEIAIKVSTGKLTLSMPTLEYVNHYGVNNGIGLLPIEPEHIGLIENLPFHHRDPFDRLLVAQSISESMPIISADNTFDSYGVVRIW